PPPPPDAAPADLPPPPKGLFSNDVGTIPQPAPFGLGSDPGDGGSTPQPDDDPGDLGLGSADPAQTSDEPSGHLFRDAAETLIFRPEHDADDGTTGSGDPRS
ncbi:MAG: hypothetical protein AAF547_25590, partial [Actinomycetota bacterium]